MAPVPENTKFHFTHPNHPLIFLSDDQDYSCDGCKTFGSGSRFRCHGCDFDLHEYCANCPQKLSSFIHHHHLTLDVLKPEGGALCDRFCDVCLDPVEGLYYRCKDCDFDAHPLCTQLPEELHHVIDENHSLKLQKLPFGSCVVCRTDCSSRWVYGCNVCGLNIHLDCLLEPYYPPAAQWTEPPVPPSSGTTSRGISFAPPPGPTGPPPVPYGFAVPYTVPAYPFGYPSGFDYGFAYNNYQASQYGSEAPPQSRGGKLKKSMFFLVGRLTMAVVTSSIFGMPLSF